jgi:hypothetical protein
LVGLSTEGRPERDPWPLPGPGAPARNRSCRCSCDIPRPDDLPWDAGAGCGPGFPLRCSAVAIGGLDLPAVPIRATAKITRTTRPNATPAATASSPSRTIFVGSFLVKSRITMLAATKMAPNMTVTAAATARTMTRRTLPVVAVLERTAQRSHRGYRLASHMASCNHYDRHFGASRPRLEIRIGHVLALTSLTWHFPSLARQRGNRRRATGDTLCA